jgi:hypothetical protein
MFYLTAHFMPLSFVAKDAVKGVFIIGSISDFLNTIYVERGSEEARKKIFQKITTRIE